VSFDCTAVVFAVLDSPILVHSDTETINQISIMVTKLFTPNHRFSLRFRIAQSRLVLALVSRQSLFTLSVSLHLAWTRLVSPDRTRWSLFTL
jgi:hypothetical protein